LWPTVAPLTSIDRPSKSKLAQASAVTVVVLKRALIDVAVLEYNLAETIAHALDNLALVRMTCDCR
jgi:hypothetical protein